jgi:Zn ribbon nucleic-acid-binding protein
MYCNANCKTKNIIYLLECAICGHHRRNQTTT